MAELALFVSLLALFVNYAQWRTANQKVVIDLYDRRLKVYSQLEAAISDVMRDGEVYPKTFHALLLAERIQGSCFGDDVRQYLEGLYSSFSWMTSFTNDVIDQPENRDAMIDIKYKHLAKITDFFKEAPELFEPYIRLTGKNTPFWRPW
jgi:hypothetical protein